MNKLLCILVFQICISKHNNVNCQMKNTIDERFYNAGKHVKYMRMFFVLQIIINYYLRLQIIIDTQHDLRVISRKGFNATFFFVTKQ